MLEKERHEIDEIDQQLIALIGARFQVTERVGQIKKQKGLPIFDQQREEKILAKVAQLAHPSFVKEVTEVYQAMMAISKEQQKEQWQPILAIDPQLQPLTGECVTVTAKTPKCYRHFGLMFMKEAIQGEEVAGWFVRAKNQYGFEGAVVVDEEGYYATSIRSGRTNIAPYEFLTWAVEQFHSVAELEKQLYRIHLVLTHDAAFPFNHLGFIFKDETQEVFIRSTPLGLTVEVQ